MTRNEAIRQIATQRRPIHFFIKAWETGHSFVDIDLIERFITKPSQEREVEGFELLDMEQMWQTVIDLDPDNLTRVRKGEGEVIEWLWKGGDGIEKKTVYPFTPEGLMTIMDDEFFA